MIRALLTAITALALAAMPVVLLTSCADETENSIIQPGCDAPPTDPYRVCDGDGGGGSGTGGGGGGSSGGGSGGGGNLCYGVVCPYGMRCYGSSGHCAPPVGTRCNPGSPPPNTTCWINDHGYCACYPNGQQPSLTSEPAAEYDLNWSDAE